MRNYFLIKTTVFFVVAALLCYKILTPVRVDMEPIQSCINRQIAEQRESVKAIQYEFIRHNSYFVRYMSDDRIAPYLRKMIYTDSVCNDAVNYLERYRQIIVQDAGGMLVLQNSSLVAPNSSINNIFITKLVADTIEVRMKHMIDLMTEAIPSDSMYLAPFFRGRFNDFKSYSTKFDGKWGRGMFYNTSVFEAITLLLHLESNALYCNSICQRRFLELGRYRCCGCYDSGGVINFASNLFLSNYDTVRGNILSCRIETRKIYLDSSVPKFTTPRNADTPMRDWEHYSHIQDVASAVGRYNRSGVIYCHVYPIDDLCVLPWSFNYMVLEKGVALQLDYNNKCYRGIPNSVSISVPGYRAEQLNLRVEGAVVVHTGGGQYTITPNGSKERLMAYIDARGNGGIINTMLARPLYVIDLPAPFATLCNKFSGEISLQEFRSAKGIGTKCFDDEVNTQYRIKSFELTVIKTGKDAIGPYKIKGDLFSNNNEAVQAVAQVVVGDKLLVSDVKAITEFGDEVIPMPFVVTVK